MAKKSYHRRPNRSGTVVKLSGNRRKPFMAKVTDGYDTITGSQIQKPIGYFETRQEALDALSLYSLSCKKELNNATLSELGGDTYQQVLNQKNKSLPTFAMLYDKVTEGLFKTLSKSRVNAYNSAYHRLSGLHNKRINTITLFDLQAEIDKSKTEVKQKTLHDMKTVCVKVFEYAVIHQHISRDSDFTSYIDTKQENMNNKSDKHKTFSISEIKAIMKDNSIEAKTVLTYIFTGCRPIELVNLNKSNIHIDELSDDNGEEMKISYIITGSKTEAGKNRFVPIHNEIKPFIKEVVNHLSRFKDVTKYRIDLFLPFMDKLGLEHLPYDTRHTFATLAKFYKMDDYSRKRIMGHKSADITDDVYTHSIRNQLYQEIHKISL